VVVLWGTTAFGAIHTIAEYVAMIIFSERDWDDPPGTGYLTVAVITICAILTRDHDPPRRAEGCRR
jgi:hypothetical protein